MTITITVSPSEEEGKDRTTIVTDEPIPYFEFIGILEQAKFATQKSCSDTEVKDGTTSDSAEAFNGSD